MKRRTLLKLMGLSAFTPSMMQTALAGESYNKNFFISLYIPGGWDTTLSFDPWIDEKRPDQSELFIEYKHSDIARRGDLYIGPAARALGNYASDLSIVNGIFLSETDNGHDAAQKYMLTGGITGQSSMVLNFADALGEAHGLGVLSNASLVKGTAKATSSSIDGVESAYAKRSTGEELNVFSRNLNHSSPLVNAIRQMVANAPNLKELFKILDDNGHSTLENQLDEALVVAAAFKSGSSQFAELEIELDSGDLDTHSNHEGEHFKILTQAMDKVKSIIDLFKSIEYGDHGESLYDRTTFMITSEFSRTAALNNAKGKDHNPMTNSIAFLGNGIKGNQMIGASKLITRKQSVTGKSYQIALPYDYESGQVIRERVNGSRFITPKNILRTMCDVLKLDPEKVNGVNRDTAALTKLVR